MNSVRLIFFVITSCIILNAEETAAERIESRYRAVDSALNDQYFQLEKDIDGRFAKLEAKIKKLWDKIETNTAKDFVYYSDDAKQRAKVAFEQGMITIEVIEPLAQESMKAPDMKSALTKQLLGLVTAKDGNGSNYLSGQLDKSSIIAAEQKTQREVYKAPDGQQKVKYRMQVPMKADQMTERAKIYIPLVIKYADMYQVPPDLILAVMETESCFNPWADNGIAYGLMQLVPSSGAYEAAKTVFGKKMYIEPYKLKKPELSIQLGTAMLFQFLSYKAYFKTFEAYPWKQELMATASYNCGAGRVKKWADNNTGLLKSADGVGEKFQAGLKVLVPVETKHYIDRVPQRRPKYAEMLRVEKVK